MSLTNDLQLFLPKIIFLFFLCFALWEGTSRYFRWRHPISTKETRKYQARGPKIITIRTRSDRRLRGKPRKRVQAQVIEPSLHSKTIPSDAKKSKIPSITAASGKNQEFRDYTPTRLPEWLKQILKKESQLDVTIQQSSRTHKAEVSTADDDQSPALCKRADEEQRQGQLFKAIDTYVQVIRIQLKSHQLHQSSPSRRALSQICKILIQVFLEVHPPMFQVRGWWLSDTLEIRQTLAVSISKMPQWPLSLATVDALQTLAEYIMKWYAPEALSCAALLYQRILSQLDNEFSFSRDKRRPYIVKELAKIYVEQLSTRAGLTKAISSAQHAIIQEGRQEIEKCSISEGMQFYQHLGALYVQRAGEDSQCSGREGEEMLHRIYEMQRQLFGRTDYRTVKTVDILSRYYVKQGGKDVEAAELIEDVLKAKNRLTPRYEDREDQKQGDYSDGEEVDDEDDDVEEAGDERKRRAIEECEESLVLRDTRATDHNYMFRNLLLPSATLQARLMSLLAPPMCVWQDSRLYLSDIAEIRFQRIRN
ncbi:hypothetical protein F4860DRAFT_492195 [Xylaria cubensis]|nr:hypothetical protein F4860DRAFT_492195 [Xylaria cubensis]